MHEAVRTDARVKSGEDWERGEKRELNVLRISSLAFREEREMQFGHRISFSLDKSAVEQLHKRDEIRSRPLLTVGRNIVGNFCVRREAFA